ncbi:MAG TPA: iron ABC transporter ATP-binding protein [Firmicutes bacterium]|nr:iron ABC transporter ATP-binding protein [Bacillota bacterium]
MITAKNVEFGYSADKKLLNGVNIEIKKGKITTILGPNGSGKSTLMGLLSAIYKVKHGEIMIDGKRISQIKQKELAKILATVHQQNTLPTDVTVEELIRFGRIPHQSYFQMHQEEDDQVVAWAMNKTNLQPFKNKSVMSLSGGERQRAFIAMALAQKTPVLFLDEPTTYLDIYHQIEILELVKQLNVDEELTVVMVLHDINQALKYSDEVIVMKNGHIIDEGITEEVLTLDLLKKVYHIGGLLQTIKEETVFIPLKVES